jgi:AraC family transcriptional regulator
VEPRIISKPAFTVVGLLQDDQKDDASIDELWLRLGSRFHEIEGVDPDVGVGVHFAQGDGQRYLVGFTAYQMDSAPVGMTAVHFDAKVYAVLTHQGTLDGIADTLGAFYSDWLPKSGYQCDDATYFEVYDDRFVPNSPDSVIAIYVPIY